MQFRLNRAQPFEDQPSEGPVRDGGAVDSTDARPQEAPKAEREDQHPAFGEDDTGEPWHSPPSVGRSPSHPEIFTGPALPVNYFRNLDEAVDRLDRTLRGYAGGKSSAQIRLELEQIDRLRNEAERLQRLTEHESFTWEGGPESPLAWDSSPWDWNPYISRLELDEPEDPEVDGNDQAPSLIPGSLLADRRSLWDPRGPQRPGEGEPEESVRLFHERARRAIRQQRQRRGSVGNDPEVLRRNSYLYVSHRWPQLDPENDDARDAGPVNSGFPQRTDESLAPDEEAVVAVTSGEILNHALARLFLRLGPPPEPTELDDHEPVSSGDGGAKQ